MNFLKTPFKFFEKDIIKETTNRINRLQHQASENETQLLKLKGDIEVEKLNGQLLRIRKDIQKAESQIEGERQGVRIVAFLQGLDELNISLNGVIFFFKKKEKNQKLDFNSNPLIFF